MGSAKDGLDCRRRNAVADHTYPVQRRLRFNAQHTRSTEHIRDGLKGLFGRYAGRHVDTDRAFVLAAFTRQTQIQRVFDSGTPPRSVNRFAFEQLEDRASTAVKIVVDPRRA